MTQENAEPDLQTAKDDTNPFGRTAYKPRMKFHRWAIILAAATIVLMALILIFRSPSTEQKTGMTSARPTKKANAAIASPVFKSRLAAQLQVNEIIAMETVARRIKKYCCNPLEKLPEKSSLDIRHWNFSDLTAGQVNRLRQQARNGDKHCADFLVLLEQYQALKNRIQAAWKHSWANPG